MTRPPEPDAPHGEPEPQVLRLERPAGRLVRLATLVADVLRAVDPARSCGGDGTPPVRVECHVDDTVPVENHPTSVRRLLESLVRDAVAAAGRHDPDAATPPLREVVITAIDTGAALEIEVADSGPPRTVSPIDLETAARLGGGLVAVPCAEGGTAVTLSLPRGVAMARVA